MGVSSGCYVLKCHNVPVTDREFQCAGCDKPVEIFSRRMHVESDGRLVIRQNFHPGLRHGGLIPVGEFQHPAGDGFYPVNIQ